MKQEERDTHIVVNENLQCLICDDPDEAQAIADELNALIHKHFPWSQPMLGLFAEVE